MPKIEGGLADISTERKVHDEALYPGTIKRVEYGKAKSGAMMFTVTSEVQYPDEPIGTDIDDYFVTVDKEGKKNEPGLRNLKKMVEALLGEERANDPDFDTDELVNVSFQAYVKIDSFEDRLSKETVKTNKIARYLRAQ